MDIFISPDGKLSGFGGTSTKIPVPPDITKAANDAVSLINKWDDKVYARSFADPKAHREVYFNGVMHVRDDLGACKIAMISHDIVMWHLDLECAHGKSIGLITMKDGKIAVFNLRAPPDQNATCPRT